MNRHQSPRMQRLIVFRSLFMVLVLVSCFLSLVTAYGQSDTATLSGKVVDQNGAFVPGTTVMIVNPSTGFTRESTTNDSGYYTFPSLAPGSYSVTVRRDGFAPIEVKNVTLNLGDHRDLRISLKVGNVSEAVTVDAGAITINTSDGSLSTVVDQTYVANMPLNGRSFQGLILLTPGVVPQTPQNTTSQLGGNGEFSVNGQRPESNVYIVDGVSANVGAAPGYSMAGTAGAS